VVSARRRGDPGKPEPLAMTDAEVAAMAREGSKEIARRIARHSPTKPVGKLASDKPAPPRISAAEVEQIRRARGRLPDLVRKRLQKAGEADVAPKPKDERKLSPTKAPPRHS
jgi:hypothetical protein